MIRSLICVCVVIGVAFGASYGLAGAGEPDSPSTESIPNNFPHPNAAGTASTFSTQGAVNLTGEYFQAQGSNGRSCATCHIAQEAWSITPATIQRLYVRTNGTHPIFNPLDANNPAHGNATGKDRIAAYSMLLNKGLFRRGGTPRANAEWELVAVDDPHGFAALDRLVQWRRPLATINFALGNGIVNWDGGNSVGLDQHAGLVNQATRNVTGGQQGPPAPPEVIADIVAFEESLSSAQLTINGVGRLDADGARGGPEALSTMQRFAGRFDIFDAWASHADPRKAQIARGQEVFNGFNAGANGSCGGCHNSANDGSNTNHLLFDVRTASAAARTPDLPLYTFRNRTTNETVQLTDAGRGNITGLWRDLGRFKTPTIRALSSRPPYFHNGIAATLEDVVRHYERHLGFVFTSEERADLVAFLAAL